MHDKLKTFLLYNRPIKIEVIIFSMGSLRELIERGSLHTSQVDQGGVELGMLSELYTPLK